VRTVAPDRHTYSVTRRWLPWRRRIEGGEVSGPDWAPDVGGLGDDPVSAVLFLLVALVLAVILLPAVLLAIGVVIEMALLLALLPLAVLVRVLFGAPWEVEVRLVSGGVWPVLHTEKVKGWSASGQRIAELAEQIRLGRVRPLEPRTRDVGPP